MKSILIKLLLINLCLTTFCHAEKLEFLGKSEFYKWVERGEDPNVIDSLVLHDLWSSRRFDYIPSEQFKNKDFSLITQLFSNLTCLILNPTLKLSDNSLNQLSNLPELRKFGFSGDYLFGRFTDNVFLIIAEAAPQLETLSLTGPFSKLKGDLLVEVLEHFPRLESVVLWSSYHKCYFNNNIHKIGADIKLQRISLRVFVNGVEIGV